MDQKVIEDGESVYGRKRLPREDPQIWADRLEDWFARLTRQVFWLRVMAFAGVAHLVWDIIGWLDVVVREGHF